MKNAHGPEHGALQFNFTLVSLLNICYNIVKFVTKGESKMLTQTKKEFIEFMMSADVL